MYLSEMINQIPPEHINIQNIDDLLNKLNKVLTTAPKYSSETISICTVSKILVSTMSTNAGFAAYTNDKINSMLKKILITWSRFLDSPESLYVINDSPNGWKSEPALKRLNMKDYIYDSNDKYWGYKSWNDFFIRKTAPGARPIAEPENKKGAAKKVIIDDFQLNGAKVNVTITALGGKKLTLPLPNIQMQNIGRDSGGTNPAEVISEVFDSITKAVVDAVSSGGAMAGDALKGVTGAAGDAAKGATDAAKGAADSIKKGIGGLFGK